MSDAPAALDVHAEAEFELQNAEGAIWTATRLLIGIVTFAWSAVAFAYFYLRAVDPAQLWRPHGTTPSVLLGTLVALGVGGGALINAYAAPRLRRGETADWIFATSVTVGLGLLAAGLQVWQLTRLSFFPGVSGYTSVFIGFAGLNIAFILGGTYWVETLLARAIRLRPALAAEGGPGLSTLPAAREFRASLEGCTYFWWYMAIISVLFWFLFYVL